MTPKRRFALMLVLLVAALIVCGWMTVQRIEQDLLESAQVALAAANIPFYGVELDGRDAVLTGFVQDPEQAGRIARIVAAIEGVRAVHDRTVVERIVDPTPSQPPAITLSPARLRIQRLGRGLFVSGRLPDDGSADALERAARSRFGDSAVTTSVSRAAGVARPDWLEAPALLIGLVESSDNLRLVIEGDAGILSGQVADSDAATRVRDLAAEIPGISWRFELFSSRGPLAGGGSP